MSDLTLAIHGLAGHSNSADSIGRFAADDLIYFSVLVVAWLVVGHRSIRMPLVVMVSAAIAVGVAAMIGLFYFVPRPFVAEHFTPLVHHAADASFPSDHLAVLGAVCGSTWFAARRLSFATGVVSTAVAIARVYAGLHWVTDVVAGFGLGLAYGVLVWYASRIASPWIRSLDAALDRRGLRSQVGVGVRARTLGTRLVSVLASSHSRLKVPTEGSRQLLALALVYLALVSAFMIWRGVSVSPDYLLLLLLPVALASGRFFRFLGDWIPFIVIFLAWEAMRGIAPKAGIPPHVGDLARIEESLFGGHLPTAVLQSWLANPSGRVVAYAATVIYFSHFVFPIGIALTLWLVDRTQFLRFATALMGMAFVAFAVFLVLPTAPPWYADSHGVITGVTKIIDTTLPSGISPYYAALNPNPVAAFPSLHAAFPFLGYLAIRETFSRRASWLVLGWCVAVWFSVVYLGEHYVIDVIAGVGLAAASWWFLNRVVAPRYRVLRLSKDSLATKTRLGPDWTGEESVRKEPASALDGVDAGQ